MAVSKKSRNSPLSGVICRYEALRTDTLRKGSELGQLDSCPTSETLSGWFAILGQFKKMLFVPKVNRFAHRSSECYVATKKPVFLWAALKFLNRVLACIAVYSDA